MTDGSSYNWTTDETITQGIERAIQARMHPNAPDRCGGNLLTFLLTLSGSRG